MGTVGNGIQKSNADKSVLSETISIEPYANEPVSKHPDSEYEYADAIGCCLAEHDIVGACLWEQYWVLKDTGTEYGGSNLSGAKLCQNTASGHALL